MKTRSLEEFNREQFTADELALLRDQATAQVVGLTLKEVRNQLGLTQAEIAERLGMAQAQVSQIESRKDFLVSTMRRYIEALGGELEISAIFNEKRIKLDNM